MCSSGSALLTGSAQHHPPAHVWAVQKGLWRLLLLCQAKSLGKEASICILTSDFALGWDLGFPHWGHTFYLQCVYLEWHCSPEATGPLPPLSDYKGHLVSTSTTQPRLSPKGIHSVASLNLLCPPTALSICQENFKSIGMVPQYRVEFF